MSANPNSPIPPIGPTTGITPPPAHGRFKPVDPLRVLRQNLHLLFVMFVVGMIVGFLAWGVWRYTWPGWTSQVVLEIKPPVDDPYQMPDSEQIAGRIDAFEYQMQTEVARMMSEDILHQAIQRPEVRDNTQWFKAYEGNVVEAREDLEEDVLRISTISGTRFISMAATTRHKQDPKRILEALIKVYLNKITRDTQYSTSDVRQAIIGQRDALEQRIRQLNEDINKLAAEEKLETLNADKSTAAAELTTFVEQRSELVTTLTSLEESYGGMLAKQQSGDTEPSAESISEIEQMPEIARMISDENLLHRELRTSERLYGINHQQTKNTRTRLEEHQARKEARTEEMIRELEAARLSGTLQAIEQYKGTLAKLEEDIAAASKRMNDMTTILEKYNYMIDLRDRTETRRVDLEGQLTDFKVMGDRRDAVRINQAGPPTDPEMTRPPKVYMFVPGITLLVLGLTVGVAFLREMLDQTVRSPMDVKLLPDAELIGVLPDATEDPSGKGNVDRVVEKHPTGLLAEQYRQVRTAILAKMDRRGYKTLLVVAAQPDCGTTSTVYNLATSLALNGRKVLMIDANFRRPSLCTTMGVNGEVGLIDVLRGDATIDQVIHPSPDMSLSVLPAGHTEDAPPELLEGSAFRSLLSELEAQYDMVLIDTSPALLASESQMLAKHVDAIAVVIRAGADKRGMIDRMLRRLDGQRADLLGVILNRVRSSAGGYFRKNYRAFYSYRNGDRTNGVKRGRADRAVDALEQSAVDETDG